MLKGLNEEIAKLEDLKAGALAKAQATVAKLQQQGVAKESITNDADYQKCLSAFNDFSATLSEKQARITDLESDVENYSKDIDSHKIQLQELAREIDQVKSERSEAVADVISARQEKELADALSGIGEDNAASRLADLRQMRNEVKAEARVSKELAGTNNKAQEAEFLEYARKSVGNSEFEQLVGLAGAAEQAPAVDAPAETQRAPRDTALPE